MKTIPCKDCVCFAICKTQAINYKNNVYYKHNIKEYVKFELAYHIYLYVLTLKCELIGKWFNEHVHFGKHSIRSTQNDINNYLNVIQELFCEVQRKG